MPFDPDTAIGGEEGRFPSTRLSLLEHAGGSGLPPEALEQVAALYWKPVYKYLRFKWRKSNEEAKDLTQGFFASALERAFFERYDPLRASFRTYLRMALDHFAANQHAAASTRKAGGQVLFVPLDFGSVEEEMGDHHLFESPEQIFQREWQRQVFALAIEDLRRCCERSGKQLQFRIFEEHDLADGTHSPYADLARRHGISVTSLNNHLAWARRTLRGLVMDRLRGVTAGESELRDEMRSVFGGA